MRKCYWIVLWGLLIAILPALAFGQTVDYESEAQDIFSEYMSPFCPGRLLADCGSSQAAELRDAIRVALANGVRADSIREQLEDTYGSSLRASPRTHGWGLLAWSAPFVFLILMLAAAGTWIVGQRKPLAVPESADLGSAYTEPDPALLEELRDELRNGR